MTSVQIKDVPEQTHRVLRRRAADAHQSLQEYLLKKLIDDAARPTLAEVFERIDSRRGGNAQLSEVVDIIRVDRDRR